jgi:hypothetical protein
MLGVAVHVGVPDPVSVPVRLPVTEGDAVLDALKVISDVAIPVDVQVPLGVAERVCIALIV